MGTLGFIDSFWLATKVRLLGIIDNTPNVGGWEAEETSLPDDLGNHDTHNGCGTRFLLCYNESQADF